jgi:streptomycin 6-kinase
MRFVGEQERIARDVRKRIRKGDNAGAVKLLRSANSRRVLSTVKQDTLAARIAMGYFVDGADETAYRMACSRRKTLWRGRQPSPLGRGTLCLSVWMDRPRGSAF